MAFTPVDPDRTEVKRRRFGPIPMRILLPNLVTLLALCVGLTGIRLAFEGKLELALYAIVLAAALDGVDGRLARLIKGQSKFGAELDSLADFMNFGCAPALFLYLWGLHQLGNVGWIAAMVFAICAALRLARFNVMIDDPNKPAWTGNFFTGVPAPAGALVVLLPIYLSLLGWFKAPATLTLVYTLAIAALMVSRIPVLSGKKVGKRVSPEIVLPIFVVTVIFLALLVSYPWEVLSIGTLLYLAALPLGWLSYRNQARKAESEEEATPAKVVAGAASPGAARPSPLGGESPADRNPPPRLN
jgi:CDP-diacylglycerol---serine O-phosphatidyltransferase